MGSCEGYPPECVVTNVLPLQWDTDFSQAPAALAAGADMPEPQLQYSGAPVAYLMWTAGGGASWLRAGAAVGPFEVLGTDGLARPYDPATGFEWSGPMPRQVQVRWRAEGGERVVWVPVIDEFGRVAATILPPLDIAEVWDQLACFPMPPDDEELTVDESGGADGAPRHEGAGIPGRASYPVRQMMQLVENIAAKQTSVPRADWTMWCNRFEQCLTQAAASPVLGEFKTLRLNPLSPLWHPPFRPDFATTGETPEGRLYEDALRRVELVWRVADLPGIGGRS